MAIRFQNASYSYNGETDALKGLDISLRRGEFVCLLGGNGSGKSTFAKHVNALLVPEEGEVFTLDRSTRYEENLFFIRSNTGLVFQNPEDQLVAGIVENDVAFGPENMGVPSAELHACVADALAEVGLQGFDRHELSELSGGQKQRVAIAGVLAMKPQIIVFDEATAMLDPRGRKGLLRICKELHENGMTVVLVTHFMDEAVDADRVIVLNEGRVVLDGTPGEILRHADVLSDFHLDIPFAVRLSLALRERGVPVSVQVDQEALKEELCILRSKR